MNPSNKLTSLLLALATVLMFSVVAFAADPGDPFGLDPNGADSDAPGDVLVYNLYASSAANPASENTRISVTNTDDQNDVSVHFYYIDGSNCSVADNYICLTKNQTATFYASDVDPGVKGYIIAMATFENGFPRGGRLLGDVYVKLASGHSAALHAQAIDGQFSNPIDNGSTGVSFVFDAPRVLAIPNIPSPAEGNNTLLAVNRLGGDLRVGMGSIGSIFGILYDQLENPYSWTSSGGCQRMATLDNNFPRTAPRIGSVIPAGSVGWMKFWSTSGADFPSGFEQTGRSITGCYLIFNPNAGNSATAFSGGKNLSQLTTNRRDVLVFPVFPSNCGFDENQ